MTDQRSSQGFRQVVPVLALAALLASSPGIRAQSAPDGPAGAPPGASAAQCCSCRVTRAVAITNDQALPCTFDVPEGWRTEMEALGPSVSLAAFPDCDTPCGVTPGMTITVGTAPNTNAATMEEVWRHVMTVAGQASCMDEQVTFFEPPGTEAGGPIGGLRFHIGFGGARYSAAASFTCPAEEGWRELERLFIGTFRTNEDSEFGENTVAR